MAKLSIKALRDNLFDAITDSVLQHRDLAATATEAEIAEYAQRYADVVSEDSARFASSLGPVRVKKLVAWVRANAAA